MIYNYCTSEEPQFASDQIEPFRLAKRAFTDLLAIDNVKELLRPLQIPQTVKKVLVNADPDRYTLLYSDVQPEQPQPSEPTAITSQQQTQTSQPSGHTIKPSSSRPKRTRSVPPP